MKSDLKSAMSLGACSGMSGYCSLDGLLDKVSLKASLVQDALSKNPELTQEIYDGISDTVANLQGGHYLLSMATAVTSLATGMAALYFAFRK